MEKGLPLPMNRTLHLPEAVTQKSMNKLSSSIIDINEDDAELIKLYAVYGLDYKPRPIKLFIDTFGGMIYACWGLIGVIKDSKVPIHTYAVGAAMSCGFMILIHGHKRFAYKHSTPMYHQISDGFWGKTLDVEDRLKETKKLQKELEQMVLDNTKIPKAKLKEIYKLKEDWLMTPKEALKLGVIDEII